MTESDNPASARTACVHWILYDLPSNATGLTEAAKPQDLPTGSRAGLNDWKHVRYDGRRSPIERRRYVFELYAPDAALPDLNSPTRAQLRRAMQGHVLGADRFSGTLSTPSLNLSLIGDPRRVRCHLRRTRPWGEVDFVSEL